MRIERITWIDSHLEVYQVSADELPTPEIIESVGYVAAETGDYVTLARERIGTDWRGVVSIPKECVRSRERLVVSTEQDGALG